MFGGVVLGYFLEKMSELGGKKSGEFISERASEHIGLLHGEK